LGDSTAAFGADLEAFGATLGVLEVLVIAIKG
jgi:hypothetical protein